MPKLDMILELLRADLTAPKTLLKQVIQEINDRHSHSEAQLPEFFGTVFGTLEDYQIDLLFSPQFTPADHNRLRYIPFLNDKSLSQQDISTIKNDLLEKNLSVVFVTPDEALEIPVTLHEVFIDRYVDLLKLDAALPASAYDDIQALVPEASRAEVNLVARDAIWQNVNRYDILKAFLLLFKANNSFSTVKASYLTNFVRTYRPESLNDVDRQLTALIDSCKKDRDQAEGRGFMDEGLKALNSDNEIPHHSVEEIRAHYQHLIDVAETLQQDLAKSSQINPSTLSAV
jgi:hypothetical protein